MLTAGQGIVGLITCCVVPNKILPMNVTDWLAHSHFGTSLSRLDGFHVGNVYSSQNKNISAMQATPFGIAVIKRTPGFAWQFSS